MCAFKYANIIESQSQFSGNYLSSKKLISCLYYKAKCARVSKTATGMHRLRKKWLVTSAWQKYWEKFFGKRY